MSIDTAPTVSATALDATSGAVTRRDILLYALVLAPVSREDHATLRDVARGADERVVLAAPDTRRVVWDHVREDQLGATGCTTQRSHSDQLSPFLRSVPTLPVQKKAKISCRRRNSGHLAAPNGSPLAACSFVGSFRANHTRPLLATR